jgi:hypothetical protein
VKVRIELRIGRCRFSKTRAGAKIAERGPGVTSYARRPTRAAESLTMPHRERASVRLCGRRFFTCPYCGRAAEHPPIFREYMLVGHAFCDHCGGWSRVEDYRTFAGEGESDAARRQKQ